MASSGSYQMTSTPVQRTQEDSPCVQFIGLSPVVGIDTPDVPVANKGLYRRHLSQIRLQQYDPSPVRRVSSNAGSQRRLRLLSTCDMCTSNRRLVPTEQEKRNSSKKPRMGMTVINKETAPLTVDTVSCGSFPLQQPVMGISVICRINTIDTIRNTEVGDNTPTPSYSDLQDIDEGYVSRSLTGSLGPTSQDQPQRITDIKQSATDVITRDLPEGEGQDQPQRITDIEQSATDVITRDLPEGEGQDQPQRITDIEQSATDVITRDLPECEGQDQPQRITDIEQSATDVITRDLPEGEGQDQPQRITDIEQSATDVITRDLPDGEGQDQPQRVTDIEQSATDVITRDLPEGEGQDQPQRVTDIEQSATDVITRDLPDGEGKDQPQRVTDIGQSATDVITRDLPEDEGIFIRRTPQMSSECPPVCLRKREAKCSAHQKLDKLRKLIRPKKTEVQMFCPH